MKRIIELVCLFALVSTAAAQKCDCLSSMKWLIRTFEENDAGFQYAIDTKGREAYLLHNEAYLDRAGRVQSKYECLTLLNEWTRFFRRGHIGVVPNGAVSLFGEGNAVDREKLESFFQDAPSVDIDTQQFYTYIQTLKDSSGWEGIWSVGPYTVGIVRDTLRADRDYVGFVLRSQSPLWKKFQVKLEIKKNPYGRYDMVYYLEMHHPIECRNIEIIGHNYLLACNIVLRRVRPVFAAVPAVEEFVRYFTNGKPSLHRLSETTLLLRIPSFAPTEKEAIDSVLTANEELLRRAEYWIIDLRNNGGGADFCYQSILPYLYTNPIRIVGMEFLSTPRNNSRMKLLASSLLLDEEQKEWARASLTMLEEHLGEFVRLDSNRVHILRMDSVLPYPKHVAILINEGCGSTTEQFLLAARQSKKVKLFGTPTQGNLDISNVYYAQSPCGDYVLFYALSRSLRIPEMAIDGKGIPPDYYLDSSIKPYEWVPYAEDILRYPSGKSASSAQH